MGVQGRSSFLYQTGVCVEQVKQFKTYGEQVELLRQRGMRVDDPKHAETLLAQLNYYRLSGYWYPMRRFSQGDGTAQAEFVAGASFDLVVALYGFDEQLRHSVFIELDRVELAIRTKLGHELGRLDPLIYLDPQRLSARARQRNKDGRSVHEVWLRKYQSALKASKEDFVAHHKSKYGGTLPIWAGCRNHGLGDAVVPVRHVAQYRAQPDCPPLRPNRSSARIMAEILEYSAQLRSSSCEDVQPCLRHQTETEQ